jgi:hypothetical protein
MFDKTNEVSVVGNFVQQHLASSKRDASDQADDRTYPPIDNTAQKLAQDVGAIDNQILALVKAGKPIPKELLDKALGLHASSNKDDRRDAQGDRDAIAKDPADMKKEQAVIDADNALLQLPNLSIELQSATRDDIRSKRLLMASEKQDIANENAYVKHDLTDIQTNDRVIKALNGNTKDLIPALEASIASKPMIGHDRREDAQLEPGYANADERDRVVNKFLLDALQNDPYARTFLQTAK